MVERLVRKRAGDGGGSDPSPSPSLKFIHSGCDLLNEVCGGGPAGAWPLGRVVNIVGDKSTGKTLLAIEACANFVQRYKGRIWYREAESAFDKSYAGALGMPIDKVRFWPKKKASFDTVETFYKDLRKACEWSRENNRPGLYILDSLDALSDAKEMDREIDAATYGGDKSKQMSTLFRKLIRQVEGSSICLIIISQVRDAIGISFGRKTRRSGGRALDFYASLTLYLAHIKTLYKTRKGQKRAVGVTIRAKCDKNKIGMPYRECDFTIRFRYGIDDIRASVEWLKSVKRLSEVKFRKRKLTKDILDELDDLDDEDFAELRRVLAEAVHEAWVDIEDSFLPKRSKYSNSKSVQ